MRGRSRGTRLLNPDFRDILSAFLAEGVEFLLVGAYALSAHGFPRATGDIDLWIGASQANAESVYRALQRFGAPLVDVTPADLTVPDLVFQIGLAPRRIDILTSITGVDFETAWASKVEITVDGMSVPVLSRPLLVQNKKATGRPQDLADLARLEQAE